MSGSLPLTPPVKRNQSSSASTTLQPHRAQHPSPIALSVRSVSSTLVNREPSVSAVKSSPSYLYLPEPESPCTPKDESRCSLRRTPSSLWSQLVSVWQSPQHCLHQDNISNYDAPSSPSSSIAASLPSPLLSSSATDPLFPLFTHVAQDSPPEMLSISASKLATWYPILLVILLFPISSAVTLATLSTLPIPNHFPKTIEDVRQLGNTLQAYSESGWTPLLHILAALCLTGLWKHAWSIPGAAILVSGTHVTRSIILSHTSWYRTSSPEFFYPPFLPPSSRPPSRQAAPFFPPSSPHLLDLSLFASSLGLSPLRNPPSKAPRPPHPISAAFPNQLPPSGSASRYCAWWESYRGRVSISPAA